jgi:hypothetical protein
MYCTIQSCLPNHAVKREIQLNPTAVDAAGRGHGPGVRSTRNGEPMVGNSNLRLIQGRRVIVAQRISSKSSDSIPENKTKGRGWQRIGGIGLLTGSCLCLEAVSSIDGKAQGKGT